jgi:hypothetical protein
MAGVLRKVREEVRKLLGTGAFFAIGFTLVIAANRLLTSGSGIEVAHYARALAGGLIVAKVLLLVDMLPFVHAFPDKPLIHNITWKSSLYIAASIVFLYIDPLIKSLFRGMGWVGANHEALQELASPRTWAMAIWLGMLLVAFVTMQELTRVIGKEKVHALFFGEKKKGDESRLRVA